MLWYVILELLPTRLYHYQDGNLPTICQGNRATVWTPPVQSSLQTIKSRPNWSKYQMVSLYFKAWHHICDKFKMNAVKTAWTFSVVYACNSWQKLWFEASKCGMLNKSLLSQIQSPYGNPEFVYLTLCMVLSEIPICQMVGLQYRPVLRGYQS